MIAIVNKNDRTMTIHTTHTPIYWEIDPIRFAVVCVYVEEMKAKDYAKN